MKRLFLMAAMLLGSGHAFAASQAPAQAGDGEQVQSQLRDYFFQAARRGDNEMLAEFIQAGYDLNTADEKGYTALILAAYNGHAETVEQLIVGGADACAEDKRGNTALMGAIFKGELRIAKRLLATECDPDQRNNAGQTPAMYAALFQREALLEALRERGRESGARRNPLALSASVVFIGQKLAGEHHVDAVTLGVRLTLDTHGEVDGAHDAVTKLLVDQLLDRAAIHIDQLIPPVDQRIGGHSGGQ